ncbi:glycosyltransferase family 39 protein [Mucilaginibacter robiniae]|uniref:Glycosyltransferase family 39 protein n=1 Tax=Mucilaginibacter robiniae TaxID=2728022 RepID=A0A7L5E3S4_9SPHI|nr:glycosyltransferase family 39 protein [Mucilaginibacter robiniae]QJD94996.1 glycosyltransferase family 39 protein [Mucilaginibacter robiniae]
MYNPSQKAYYNSKIILLLLVALKLFLNFLAAPHYGFHRDELLHLALGDHLGWGYMEVPPVVGWLARITTAVFGSSLVAARVFPAIASALMLWFTGLLTIELGGGRFAVLLAGLCMLFSPGMVASCYLFQPVVFDQLWWLLATWALVKYVNTNQVNYLYGLGLIVGIGLLTKYTMAFFAGALLVGFVLTPQRKLLTVKPIIITILIASVIFLPNIIWQYEHHWPVVAHMDKLQRYQLDYVKPSDFILQQLLLHGLFGLVWIIGLGFLLFSKKLRPYQFAGLAYLLVFAFLLFKHGKAYYLLAGYPMLFAAGGCGIAWLVHNYTWRIVLAAVCLIPNLLLLPLVLPILPIRQTLSLFRYNHQHLPLLDFTITWEDQKPHALTQDYADMYGWDEMAAKVSATYHSLTPEQQRHTLVYADTYGEAGALHQYRHQYHLPDVICMNSSFALWAPESLKADYIIYVSDDNDISDLNSLVESYRRVGIIDNPLAREKGVGIFLIAHPKPALTPLYQKNLRKNRLE